jgi:hypothetical protein
MKATLLSLGVALCAASALGAQTTEVPIQINHLRAKLSSNGQLSSDAVWLEAQGPNGWAPLISDLGIWLAGRLPDGGVGFFSSARGGEPRTSTSPLPLNRVWSVTAEQVAAHRADFADNGRIDNPIPAIYAWPGTYNPHFQEYNGFDFDLSRHLAPYWDANGDAVYNPADGDFPILGIRACFNEPYVPTEMHWCVFTMEDPQGRFGPFELQLTVFGFGCEEESHPLNNTLFTLHKIIYFGEEAAAPILTDCYWGQWVDPDLGCYADDYVGSFPELSAAYVYNANSSDCDAGTGSFGAQPPVLGISALRGPLDNDTLGIQPAPLSSFMYFNNPSVGSPPPATTDPVNVIEFYRYLQGNWRDGSPLTEGGIGYGGNTPADFIFPGLPQQPGGWTEHEAQNPPGDRRLLLSYGPFSLWPGGINEMISAYTLYSGPEGHLGQVEPLREQIAQVNAFFDLCFITEGTGLPPCTAVMTHAPHRDAAPPKAAIFPNPASTWLRLSLPESPQAYRFQLYDLHGRLLLQQALPGGEQQLSLPALPAGVYVAILQSGQGWRQVERVVVHQE